MEYTKCELGGNTTATELH